MSDYTIINLAELEEPSSGDVSMTFGRKHLDSKDLGISLEKYKPNVQSKNAHSHKVQEEAYVVVRGSGKVLLNGEAKDLKVWDVVRVAPETIRAFEAGPEGLDLIAVGGPKPEDGDGVKQEANWPS